MAGMSSREVSNRLSILQFGRLCSLVDKSKGETDTKFDVLSIGAKITTDTTTTIEIVVMFNSGSCERMKIAA